MPFARKANGVIVGIDDLTHNERGASCDCTCLSCGLPVIARMGEHNTRCFAHDYHAKADSERCSYSPETVIRIVMMEVLAELEALPMQDGSHATITNICIDDHVNYDACAMIEGHSQPVNIEIPPPGRVINKVSTGLVFRPERVLSLISGATSSRSSIVAAMLQNGENRSWEWLPFEYVENPNTESEENNNDQNVHSIQPKRISRQERIETEIKNAIASLPDDPAILEADELNKYLGLTQSNPVNSRFNNSSHSPVFPTKKRIQINHKKCHLCNIEKQEFHEFCNKCKGRLISVTYKSEAQLEHAIKYGTIKLHEQRLLLAKTWPHIFGAKPVIDRSLAQWLEILSRSMSIANVPCRDGIRRQQGFIDIKLERPYLLITWENHVTSKVLPQAYDAPAASEIVVAESFLYLPLDGDPQWYQAQKGR